MINKNIDKKLYQNVKQNNSCHWFKNIYYFFKNVKISRADFNLLKNLFNCSN